MGDTRDNNLEFGLLWQRVGVEWSLLFREDLLAA